LKSKLAEEIQIAKPERRAYVRVALRVIVSLKGKDTKGNEFQSLTITENASAGGFLSGCLESLPVGTIAEVFLGIEKTLFAGGARVVRCESPRTPWQKYAFQFVEKPQEWMLAFAS